MTVMVMLMVMVMVVVMAVEVVSEGMGRYAVILFQRQKHQRLEWKVKECTKAVLLLHQHYQQIMLISRKGYYHLHSRLHHQNP